MPPDFDRYQIREQEDSASRLARRFAREERRRVERRRGARLVIALATVGTLLLVSGLSVALARGGRSSRVNNTAAPVASPVSAPSPKREMPEADPPAAEKPSAPPVKDPSPPAPKAATEQESTKKASTPSKKKSKAKSSQPGLVTQKCGKCHSGAQVSAGKLNLESATSSVDGMIDGGYLKLTPSERDAVIAALTGN